MEIPRGSLCAACGQPGHRYGRNEGIDRFNPQACINGLLAKLEVPRGFARCDECVNGRTQSYLGGGPIEDVGECPSCSGSGLVPTEKLREEAARAAYAAFDDATGYGSWAYEVGVGRSTDAVLRKVAEHLGGRE